MIKFKFHLGYEKEKQSPRLINLIFNASLSAEFRLSSR